MYLPLIRLLTLHIEESERLYGAYRTFLLPGTEPPQRTPFVIGIAGSVSVGQVHHRAAPATAAGAPAARPAAWS